MARSLEQPAPSKAHTAAAGAQWTWFAVALAAQTCWGIYPVLGRYMQTVSGLPSMSLLVLGGMPMLIALFVYVLPRYGWGIYRVRGLWVFGVVVVLRSITNLLSQRFTLAMYVQLMALLTPFLVVFLSRALLRGTHPSPYRYGDCAFLDRRGDDVEPERRRVRPSLCAGAHGLAGPRPRLHQQLFPGRLHDSGAQDGAGEHPRRRRARLSDRHDPGERAGDQPAHRRGSGPIGCTWRRWTGPSS